MTFGDTDAQARMVNRHIEYVVAYRTTGLFRLLLSRVGRILKPCRRV